MPDYRRRHVCRHYFRYAADIIDATPRHYFSMPPPLIFFRHYCHYFHIADFRFIFAADAITPLFAFDIFAG